MNPEIHSKLSDMDTLLGQIEVAHKEQAGMAPKMEQIRTKWQKRRSHIQETTDSLQRHYSDLGDSLADLEWASENVRLLRLILFMRSLLS